MEQNLNSFSFTEEEIRRKMKIRNCREFERSTKLINFRIILPDAEPYVAAVVHKQLRIDPTYQKISVDGRSIHSRNLADGQCFLFAIVESYV